MANYQSSYFETHKVDKTFNRSANLADENSSIEGGVCTWIIPTLGASRTITVLRPDFSRTSEYLLENGKPIIIIKCVGDASVNTAIISTADGSGSTKTLYTFAADYSATPRYIALRVSTTYGTDGKPVWELC